MKKIFGLLFVIITITVSAQNLNQELAQVYQDYNLMGLSIWVDVRGNPETYHFGLRDFDRNLPVTEATKFRIASISKSFTALGLLKLYNDGLFDLDDDISDVLGYMVRNPQFPNIPITYRMLLSHQSSLQDGTGYNNFLNATFNVAPIPNISELIVPGGTYYTSNMWRTETPGSFFAYSNVNFGLIGTLIEAHSQERFDIFMTDQILEPLGITGSYNIQDLPDINDLGVLYRYQNGWNPQIDNYQGNLPPPPDLSSYIPGTNGVYFGPQGSLRTSASDIGAFINYLNESTAASVLGINPTVLQEMKAIAWDYNGSNGDNYFGLFNRWGLGLHHSNTVAGDQICNLGAFNSFLGHPGEAYGLVSDAYFNISEEVSFALIINGIEAGYTVGSNSSYYTVEEAIFAVLCNYFNSVLGTHESLRKSLSVFPNPTRDTLNISFPENIPNIEIQLYSLLGKRVYISEKKNINTHSFSVKDLESGLYFLEVKIDATTYVEKIVIQ